MWVITEAYSIIIKNSTLNHLYPWWVEWYKISIPNQTYCSDWFITRIWFMSSEDNKAWLEHLSKYNIEYLDENEQSKDICIHSQKSWPLCDCNRLEFTKDNNIYSGTEIAWLKWSKKSDISIPENRYPEEIHYISEEEHKNLEISSDENWLECASLNGKKVYHWKCFKENNELEVQAVYIENEDWTTSPISLNSEEQFMAKMILSDNLVIKWLSKYKNIMELVNTTDVSKDKDFQKKFNNFYKIHHRTSEFYKAYYDLLEMSKKNISLSFEWILMYLFWKFWKCEKSFASKLLHTINPEMPIWDKFVLKNLWLKDPWPDINKSVELYNEIKKIMIDKLSSEEWRMIVQIFDKLYPDSNITDIKKYDFYLWQLR